MRNEDDSVPADPAQDARAAIWRLFDEGYVDEDMATAGLLALDLGMRRAQRDAYPSRLPRKRGTRGPRPRR